jgi:large conductance mechanosensitive channel
MLKEFKDFAVKGSGLDMAIGIVIGGAFSPIIKSLVDDILMPVIGLFLGGADFVDNMMVRTFNRWKKEEEAAPAEPPKDIVLLEEIRDSLRSQA